MKTVKTETAPQKRKRVLTFLREVNSDQRWMVYTWSPARGEADPAVDPEQWDKLASYAANKARDFLALQQFAKQQANDLR